MSATPSVSIGLPVFNGERFLEASLRSILAQTHEDFELIVSDNASTDRTREICRDFAAGDTRIRYSRNPENLGAAANYNRVFELARAPYFKWVAHDDAYAPEFLERCLGRLQGDSGTVACYSPAIFIDESGAELGQESSPVDLDAPRPRDRLRAWVLERQEGWCHPITGVIRSDVLRRTRRIAAFVSADVVLVAELALWGRVRRTHAYLFYRRDHSGRSTAGDRSIAELTAWFDPKAGPKRVYMPRWRWGLEYSRAVARVPMPAFEKMACASIMARWFARSRRRLTDEMIHWAGRGAGSSSRSQQRS